ncbi:hypothetical protein JL720_604 [Aureococcus anophagefferens]|nr:hypothetical protein JL720_604 [Aureococcus anophagefferens]
MEQRGVALRRAETAEADRDAALEREEALGKRLEELKARAAQFDDRYRDVERQLSESHVAGSQLQSQHDEFLRVYEKEHHAFQNSDRERQKLVARIASLERQLDFAAKARDDARKHAEDARALADEHANRHKELVSRHRALDAREVEIEHKSDVTPIHMANLPGEQFRRSIIESDV